MVSGAVSELGEEHHLGKSRVVHPDHMSSPSQLGLHHQRFDARGVGPTKYFCVGDSVLPVGQREVLARASPKYSLMLTTGYRVGIDTGTKLDISTFHNYQ